MQAVSDVVRAGMAAGNINISSLSADTFALSAGSQAAKAAQELALREQEIARKARSVVVPTNDNLVRKKLRELGEPITLFGERVSALNTHTHRQIPSTAFALSPPLSNPLHAIAATPAGVEGAVRCH